MGSVTDSLLMGSWDIYNMGVSGENTLTIGARYGAIPMYLNEAITLPADQSKVHIESGIFSTYNNKNIFPLLQGNGGINPCRINGIECELSIENNMYQLKKIDTISTQTQIAPNSIIETYLSKQTKGVVTIFIGQNGEYNSPLDFLQQIDMFVDHKQDDNFIIITSHGNGDAETIEPILEKYGNHVINLKDYMVNYALDDAIDLGLLPNDGSYPTSMDTNAINHSA